MPKFIQSVQCTNTPLPLILVLHISMMTKKADLLAIQLLLLQQTEPSQEALHISSQRLWNTGFKKLRKPQHIMEAVIASVARQSML